MPRASAFTDRVHEVPKKLVFGADRRKGRWGSRNVDRQGAEVLKRLDPVATGVRLRVAQSRVVVVLDPAAEPPSARGLADVDDGLIGQPPPGEVSGQLLGVRSLAM